MKMVVVTILVASMKVSIELDAAFTVVGCFDFEAFVKCICFENKMSKDWGDVEPVDQKKYLEDSCKPKCVRPLIEYQACVKRVEGDDTGEKHCTGQYFDYWHCIDRAVAPKLFEKLK
ncbi:hypothetical protein L6452_01405 [Arctium lappa]|uniref:Uncharacterized protein n=1 Tax=Arctium lappa TaxID=4217 RepID=A0ACB9FH80_ARCLA|nr:hypothetical protein L6452_01405 [Arctium lappa]